MKKTSSVRFLARVSALGGFAVMLACADTPATPSMATSPSTTLAAVSASPQNTILAVGGTQQLSVAGTSLTEQPITQFDSVVYKLDDLADTLRVQLTATGLVTGLASSVSPIRVDVYVFLNGVARGDQVLLQVTPTVIAGLTLSIQPDVTDSARLAVGTPKFITPVIQNPGTGESVDNPTLLYSVKRADAKRVQIYIPYLTLSSGIDISTQPSYPYADVGQIMPLVPTGSAWIYASVSAYGTMLRDSVLYTFSYPYSMVIATGESGSVPLDISNAFADQVLTLAPGATITFANYGSDNNLLTVSYTFDDPAAATEADVPSSDGGSTGNVSTLTSGLSSDRKFNTPGTYHWTASAAGWPSASNAKTLSGTIVVQ